jgi:hypothetical protein
MTDLLHFILALLQWIAFWSLSRWWHLTGLLFIITIVIDCIRRKY